MTIKQFNGAYLANEDRILFRFNTQNQEEYRFWFTRRVALFILAATSHLLAKKLDQTHSPDAAKAVSAFEKEAILEATKNEHASQQAYEAGLNFPLGFDPILVMDVTCALTQNGEKLAQLSDLQGGLIDDLISIDFALPGGANLNLNLAIGTLQAMCVLLDQLRQQAAWGEAILQVNNAPNEEQAMQVKTSKNVSIH
ncbi:hypothetical protein G6652_08845 [Polynucleobacter paneuropaeus]|jgi:hypothetical protein|nr:hypothetical protein [Polynucleobacter paneuropaeus]MBT8617330.1 hypothetical protein [Polynucleobacter paneuropaeus]MBT8619211.1 hypothetical protein [Polynucleobacter paneuropaeus]MBT8620222.1 hypothetical protein [Polynucleobacter paneuropaeus]MBT8626526.1 hypothetical protein [Polynucleobacter paneuropaeus]